MKKKNSLPLSGIRVLELSHAVMGPTCGLILADMGAEVIKIERAPEGDETRRLKGFGIGFFPFLNRNKKSMAIDLKSDRGREVLKTLVISADVFLENFAPGTIGRLGFGYDKISQLNPRLIYCALKGFMPGPYEKRPALDEVVQMMAGLAYMTGPLGQPLRAGASVVDIMGGTFGAVAIMTALYEREKTGKGQADCGRYEDDCNPRLPLGSPGSDGKRGDADVGGGRGHGPCSRMQTLCGGPWGDSGGWRKCSIHGQPQF